MLVVDDQPVVIYGMTRCLTEHGFDLCGVVSDVGSLPAQVALHRPGLVVIETAMQNRVRTLAAVDEVVSQHATPVLAFTTDISLAALQAALEHGCMGVVPRSATVEAFVAGAFAVAAGERHLHQRVLAVLVQGIQFAEVSREVRELSGREFSVLGLVAEGQTNASIAEQLGISHATVKTHVENILHKLNAADRAQAVSRAMRLGLLQ